MLLQMSALITSSHNCHRNSTRGGFRHVQRAAEHGPHKKGPHRPDNVGQQRDISWSVMASLWRVRYLKVHLVQNDILWPMPIC